MNNKKGFVIMEAIVVITVLCVILVTLYGAYSKILIESKKQSLYDNTEYIYKTTVVRNILENDSSLGSISSPCHIYCNNIKTELGSPCSTNNIFNEMGVEAIYITKWDISISDIEDLNLEATTQKYIKSLDVAEDDAYRIIVMYKQENNSSDKPIYEYASLRFGSRG